MKLKFTRKTWYFFLLAAACATLLHGLAVLAGQDWSFLEMAAFCITALTVLFLAAERESTPAQKRWYVGIFAALMASYLFNGWFGWLCAALAGPLRRGRERRRGAPIRPQLVCVCVMEALHLLLLLGALYGADALAWWTNTAWVLLAVARGSAALALYKWQEEA